MWGHRGVTLHLHGWGWAHLVMGSGTTRMASQDDTKWEFQGGTSTMGASNLVPHLPDHWEHGAMHICSIVITNKEQSEFYDEGTQLFRDNDIGIYMQMVCVYDTPRERVSFVGCRWNIGGNNQQVGSDQVTCDPTEWFITRRVMRSTFPNEAITKLLSHWIFNEVSCQPLWVSHKQIPQDVEASTQMSRSNTGSYLSAWEGFGSPRVFDHLANWCRHELGNVG